MDIRFWMDSWYSDSPLKDEFYRIFLIASDRQWLVENFDFDFFFFCFG